MADNIKPVHKSLQSVGSTSTHSLLTLTASGSKAYRNLRTHGIDSTHTSLGISGYQYYEGLTTIVTATASGEVVDVTDVGFINYTVLIDETVLVTDVLFAGTIPSDETVLVTDEGKVGYTVLANETVLVTDQLSASQGQEALVNVTDQNIINYKIFIDEVVRCTDEGTSPFLLLDVTDSVLVQIGQVYSIDDSVTIQVAGKADATDSVTIGIIQEGLSSVTNASGATYAIPLHPLNILPNDPGPTPLPTPGEVSIFTQTNPWEPSIILDGFVYASSVSTLPPTYGPQSNFVQWLDISLPGGNNSSSIFDFSFSLGFDGGSFSLLTQTSVGNKGDEITIFGLQATITRVGKKSSNGANGIITKGIFGSARMNKEFNIINNGNQYYIQYVGSQVLYPFNVQPNQQMSVWDMCRNIAIASSSHLGFHVVDSPYTDVLGQSGQTGLEALGSLASQVGAQLRWSGNNLYTIVYPNFSSGTFTVPSPYLLTAEGTEYETILDLGLGVTGTGILQIPKANPFNTDTTPVPGDTAVTIIDQQHTIRTAIPAGAPPQKFPLPADTSSAKIQIIVNDTTGTGSATGPGAGWITQNDSIWFDLGSPGLSNPYVKLSDSNISYKPYALINSGMFPDIDAVNNGEFAMNIGIERASLGGNYQDEVDAEANRLKDLINRMLANLRFIKTYEGTINCFFYGVIPLPGMWASATNICGETVEGIIESVSFSAPGILTIQVAQYLRINFLDSKLDYTSNPLNSVI